MLYNFNGMSVSIPDAEIDNLVDNLDLTMEEAIDLYLTDHNYKKNKEQEELNEKAKDIKAANIVQAGHDKPKEKVVRTKKIDENKKALFNSIISQLVNVEDLEIITADKLVKFKYNGEEYKLDLIKTRVKKQ